MLAILDKYNANVKITEAPPNHQIFFCSEKWQVDDLISGRGCVQRSYKITEKEVLSYAVLAKVIKANLLSLKIQKNMQTSEELSPLHHKDTGGIFVYSSWAQLSEENGTGIRQVDIL